MRRRLQAIQAEFGSDHGSCRRDYDREVLGKAAGHHRVYGNLLDRRLSAPRGHKANDLSRIAAPALQHLRNAFLRGRNDRQSVGPTTEIKKTLYSLQGGRRPELLRRAIGTELVPKEALVPQLAARRYDFLFVLLFQADRVTRQNAKDLRNGGCRDFRNPRRRLPRHGMGDIEDRQAGHAEDFRFGLSEGEKLVGAHGSSGNAFFLQHDRVVDTPRRAGPSVTECVDDEATAFQEFFVEQRRHRSRFFPNPQHVGKSKILFQDFEDLVQKYVRIVLAVVEKTDHTAVQILDSRRDRLPFVPGDPSRIHQFISQHFLLN